MAYYFLFISKIVSEFTIINNIQLLLDFLLWMANFNKACLTTMKTSFVLITNIHALHASHGMSVVEMCVYIYIYIYVCVYVGFHDKTKLKSQILIRH